MKYCYFYRPIFQLLDRYQLEIPIGLFDDSKKDFAVLFSILKKCERANLLTYSSVRYITEHPDWRGLNYGLSLLIQEEQMGIENFSALLAPNYFSAPLAYAFISLSKAEMLTHENRDQCIVLSFEYARGSAQPWWFCRLLNLLEKNQLLNSNTFNKILDSLDYLTESTVEDISWLDQQGHLSNNTFENALSPPSLCPTLTFVLGATEVLASYHKNHSPRY